MAFVVDRRQLQKILSNVGQASRGVQYKAVMGRSKGTTLTIWFDSLEGHLWQFIENQEATDTDLAFSVSITSFHKLIAAWKSKTISLEQGNKQSLVVSSGRSIVNVPYYDDGVSLDIPSEPVGAYIGVVPGEFVTNIKESVNFIGQMSNRPELACVELKVTEKGSVVTATDSYSVYHSSYEKLDVPMSSVRFNERVIKTMGAVFSDESIQLYRMEDESVILKGEDAILQMVPIRMKYPDLERILVESQTKPFMTLNMKNTMEIIKVVEAVSKGEQLVLRPPHVEDTEGGVTVGIDDIQMEAMLKIEDSTFISTEEVSYLPVDAKLFKQCVQVFGKNDYVTLEKMDNGFVRIKGDGDTTQFTCLAPLST